LPFDDSIEWFEREVSRVDVATRQITLPLVAYHTTTDQLQQTMINIALHPELFSKMLILMAFLNVSASLPAHAGDLTCDNPFCFPSGFPPVHRPPHSSPQYVLSLRTVTWCRKMLGSMSQTFSPCDLRNRKRKSS
jgi:hypothetical protein